MVKSLVMGETLGISHNVFEKVVREKDRKERIKKYEEWQKEKKHRMKEIQNRANTIKKPQNDNSASHQQANLRNLNGAAGSDPGQSSVVAAGSSSPEDNPDKDNLVMSNAIEDHEPLTYRESVDAYDQDRPNKPSDDEELLSPKAKPPDHAQNKTKSKKRVGILDDRSKDSSEAEDRFGRCGCGPSCNIL